MEPRAPAPARAVRPRWASAGRSGEPDAASAGAAAARVALAGGEDPRVLLVFASAEHDLDALAAGIATVTGGHVPLAGCTSGGELAGCGVTDRSVVVLALGGEGLSVSTTAVTGAGADPRGAGAQVAASLGDVADRDHRILMLFTDGPVVVDQPEVLRGAYSVAGAGVPIVGGVAGGDGPTAQLHGSEVLRGAVVGVALGSDAPFGIGARHGLHPVGEPRLVTRSVPGRVLTIDDRPAQEVLGAAPDGVALGLRRRVGEAQVRFAVLDGGPDGGVACDLPPGGLVWRMEGERAELLDAADHACRDALDGLGGRPPTAVLVFDCASRRAVLGDDGIAEEACRIAARAGDAAIAGLFTHGEFARTCGSTGFHDKTIVVLAIA